MYVSMRTYIHQHCLSHWIIAGDTYIRTYNMHTCMHALQFKYIRIINILALRNPYNIYAHTLVLGKATNFAQVT
jgi:hypothetical protein